MENVKTNITIVHIIDDHIHLNGVLKLWAEMFVESVFLCLVPNDKYEIEFINEKERVLPLTLEQIKNYLMTSEYDAVLFHSLPQYKYPLVLSIPKDRVVLWATWGYDVYYSAYPIPAVVPMTIYQPITQFYFNYRELKTYIYRLWMELKNRNQGVKSAFSIWYNYFWGDNSEYIEMQQKVLARIDYISAVLGENEYAFFKQNPNLTAKYFLYKYIGKKKIVDDTSKELIDFPSSTRILLGNSMDPSNNHVDILILLKKRGIKMPLYIPMAYAKAPKHYKKVIERVLKLLRMKNYYIQDSVCDYQTYKDLLRSCRVAVFGHLRQQSIGNVWIMLKQGSKVFLYKNGVNYQYLKKRGYYVYSIEDDLTQKEIDTPLTPDQIRHNRILLEEIDYDTFIESLSKTMKEVKCVRNNRKE